MIPKQFRLILSASKPFSGQKLQGKWCFVISKPAELPSWAVRVSKKIDNRATVRNRLRRQINQWAYQNRESLKPQQSLIILRRKLIDKNDLLSLFEEIKKYTWKLNPSH